MSAYEITTTSSESVIRSADFHPRFILRHLDESIVVTDKRVIVRKPNTIFAIIKLGYNELSAPLDALDTITSGRQTSTRKLVAGIVAALFALSGFVQAVIAMQFAPLAGVGLLLLALVIAVVAAFFFLTAVQHEVGIGTSGGQTLFVSVGSQERAEADVFRDVLGVIATQRTEATAPPA